ncbi:MAG: hypothetical protein ACR2RD_10220 [Woeseiaceae bacterium]
MRLFRVVAGVTVTAAMFWAASATAQESGVDNDLESDDPSEVAVDDSEAPSELPEEMLESKVMDEITVIAGPQGKTAFQLEMERQALMREAIYAEMRLREREAEEIAWRKADPDLKNPNSRIKWGYSAQAEQRMRRENEFIHDLPIDQVKPASLFRAEF